MINGKVYAPELLLHQHEALRWDGILQIESCMDPRPCQVLPSVKVFQEK